MKKILIVVDMQNDFVTGSLGSPQAKSIVSKVKAKIKQCRINDYQIIFTRDTHFDNYLLSQEGKALPVVHCIAGSEGHRITSELDVNNADVVDKTSFGSLELARKIAESNLEPNEIELCGLCSDICVVSNAIILKAQFPETIITVDASCCAGVTQEGHKAALLVMKRCQVNIINEC